MVYSTPQLLVLGDAASLVKGLKVWGTEPGDLFHQKNSMDCDLDD